MPFKPESLEALSSGCELVFLGGALVRMPGERVGQNRLGEFAPRRFFPGGGFQLALGHGGMHHHAPCPFRVLGRQVDGLGPADALAGQPFGFARLALVMEVVERRALKGPAALRDRRGHRFYPAGD
jgi:hypothetical protein